MTDEGLQIVPPAELGDSMFAWAFEIVTHSEQHSPTGVWDTNSLFRPEEAPELSHGEQPDENARPDLGPAGAADYFGIGL